MPFKSSAQRAWMFKNHPEMAKEWASHMTHAQEKSLPKHVKKNKKKK